MIAKFISQSKNMLRLGALLALFPLAGWAVTWTGGGYWSVDVPSAGSASSEAYTNGTSGAHAACTLYPNGGSPIYSINAFTQTQGIPDDERASASLSAGTYYVSQVQIGSGSVAWTTITW